MSAFRLPQPVRQRSALLLSLLLLTSLAAAGALSTSELVALNELARRGWIPSASCGSSLSASTKVACSTSGSTSWVTQLNLAASSPLLNGTIPTQIGLLANLTQLDITGNRLVGSVSSEIAKLTGLTRLTLNANQLSGWLDDGLSSLKSVTSCAFGPQSEGFSFNCSATLQRSAFATRCGLTCGPETVLLEDAVPSTVPASLVISDTGPGPWSFGTSPVYSGCCAHLSPSVSVTHQHYFDYSIVLVPSVSATAVFSTYVYLYANDMPRQLMLQFRSPQDWHRAAWAASATDNPVQYGTYFYMGPIPEPGMWHRLEVKASDIGIVGKSLGGLAFSLYGGSAAWDRSGYTDLKACTRTAPTNGAVGGCGSTESETRCSVACNDGYTPTPSFSQCTAGNLMFPQTCKENGCTGTAPENGQIGTCAVVAGSAYCSVTCNAGYTASPSFAFCSRGKLVSQTCVALSGADMIALTELVRRGWIPSASCDSSLFRSVTVFCSASGSSGWVSHLNLAASSPLLNGTIPTKIGLLANLTQLNLAGNRLVGSVPSEIAGLTRLTRLTLKANQLSGWLDDGLSSLKSMTSCSFGPQSAAFNFSCSATLQRSAFATRCGLTCGPETVLMEDSLPAALPLSSVQVQADQWLWVTSLSYSGCCSHVSQSLSTTHQHFFGPTYNFGLPLMSATAVLSTYIYLTATDMPTQLMLQFGSSDDWHRASWAASAAVNPLEYGPFFYMGPIPEPSMWHRLEVKASDIGLVGKALGGLAFSLYGGTATWDRSGYTDLKPCTRAAPANGGAGTCNLTNSETRCSIVCNDGYTPTPASSQCSAGTLVFPQVCKPNGCRRAAPQGGQVGTCASVASGATCSVTCDQGFTVSPSIATCVAGMLTPQTCNANGCKGTAPQGGQAGSCASVASGATCSVTCDRGFTASPSFASCFAGNLTAQTCNAGISTTSGQPSPPALSPDIDPVCNGEAPINGTIGTCEIVSSGSRCSVACEEGSSPSPATALCTAGTLTVQACKPDIKGAATPCTRSSPANGALGTCGAVDSGLSCSIICDDGFSALPETALCTAGSLTNQVCSGSASVEEPYAAAIGMGAIIGLAVGIVCFCCIIAVVVVVAILLVRRSRTQKDPSTELVSPPIKSEPIFTPAVGGSSNAGVGGSGASDGVYSNLSALQYSSEYGAPGAGGAYPAPLVGTQYDNLSPYQGLKAPDNAFHAQPPMDDLKGVTRANGSPPSMYMPLEYPDTYNVVPLSRNDPFA